MPVAASDSVRWLEALSPWPTDGFGLDRIRALLDRLGSPQRRFESLHVVGTKGKSTAARSLAATLRAAGLSAAAYTSPHVEGWHERLETDEAGFRAALERVRPDSDALGATQFETLTAAAFVDFAARGVDAAVVEAGLGGRHDATNVVDARVVLLTNVGLEHTEVLGSTRGEIAAEKLAVAHAAGTVVLPDGEFAALAAPAAVRLGGVREAAEAFLGRSIDRVVEARLPGRLELRAGGEVRDGAHTPEAVDWLLDRLPEPGRYVVVASILADKDADGILERLARAGQTLVATESSNRRALPADELAGRAGPWFARVEAVPEPRAALERARALGGPVLATGSLYLLADLCADR
ncbi:MAG TPA: Mur ligase family protein [Gaiellaceae bacterium]|nr:Mur ligase family protein [Gaiellaceae bacterium]